MPILPEPHFKTIGHRGACAFAPENTLASFECAANYGLNWVEFDTVRLDSGEWVVIHDNTLERTTNGKGQVLNKSLEYLQSLDAGIWFDPVFKNERIPLLTETLDYLFTLGLQANIEIKTMRGNPELLIQSFLACIAGHWPISIIPPLISSFDLNLLIALSRLQQDPVYPLGYIIHEFKDSALELAIQYGFKTLNCDYRYLTPETILKANAHQIAILPYTVNDPMIAQQLLAQGATAIFSNYPDLLKEHCQS